MATLSDLLSMYDQGIDPNAPQPSSRPTLGGILAYVDNLKRKVGRNLSDLVTNPNMYAEKVAARLPQTVQQMANDPSNYIPGGGLVAQTAWHGSPHKFSKFDLGKIGTGEGAQAYGHGLYLAESPKVAQGYQEALARDPERFFVGGQEVISRQINGPPLDVSNPKTAAIFYAGKDGEKAARKYFKSQGSWGQKAIAELDAMNGAPITREAPGHLYKTDIPDEAVARFLDWDKPLSQQESALASLKKAGYGRTDTPGVTGGYYAPKTQEEIDNLLAAGIPGIRYLDGGSRSAGQGSSNFVVFDPEMIRILERNNEATGLKPWAPGEWSQLRDLVK